MAADGSVGRADSPLKVSFNLSFVSVRRDTRIPTWKGEYVLSVDGRADQVLKPGDWFGIPAEVPHSVRYDGGRALGHYVVERVEAGT